MGFIKDFTAINKVVFRKTNESYAKNLLLLPATWLYIIVYSLLTIVSSLTIGRLGDAGQMVSGLITWLLGCYMMSDYFVHIGQSIIGGKFKFSGLNTGGLVYFNQMLAVTAIPRIVAYLIAMLTGIGILSLLVIPFIFTFAILEVAYQKNLDRLDIFVYGFKFFKANWKQWSIINIILLMFIFSSFSLIQLVYGFLFSGFEESLYTSISNVTNVNLLYFFNLLISSIGSLIQIVMFILPLQYIIIYRGFIFKILSVSSLRKREYMRNIYGKH